MNDQVYFSDKALKSLKQIDHYQRKMILSWIEKNLEGCRDPRAQGKALTGDQKGYWRYRVGSYRIIADIQDKAIRIDIVNIAHRRNVYESNND